MGSLLAAAVKDTSSPAARIHGMTVEQIHRMEDARVVAGQVVGDIGLWTRVTGRPHGPIVV